MARLFKIKVLKFAIGFGPKIFTKKTEKTEYTLRLIPFGGFVQMEGEEQRSNDKDAFNNKPVWQRILVVVAGAMVNIVFALIIYFAIASSSNMYESSVLTNVASGDSAYEAGLRTGDEILEVNGKKTLTGWKVKNAISASKNDDINFKIKRNNEIVQVQSTIPYTSRGLIGVGFSENKEISYIMANTPASESNLEVGDVVTKINGIELNSTEEIVNTIRSMPNKDITLTIIRNDEELNVNLTTFQDSSRHFDINFEIVTPGFWKGLRYAIDETMWYFGANMEAYAKLFAGKAENVEVMGVVGIASEITSTSAVEDFFYMMCAISLSLGIFNLLPIPALDGGRILLLIIEGIRRKPLNEKLEQNIILIGFAVIIIFAIIVTIFDVSKLF